MTIIELENHAKVNNWSLVEDSGKRRVYLTSKGGLKEILFNDKNEVEAIVRMTIKLC